MNLQENMASSAKMYKQKNDLVMNKKGLIHRVNTKTSNYINKLTQRTSKMEGVTPPQHNFIYVPAVSVKCGKYNFRAFPNKERLCNN